MFCDFVVRSGLPIALVSVEGRRPPEPDIVCVHQDLGQLGFELVEMCDPTIARTIASMHNEETTYLRGMDRARDILRQKLSKSYVCEYPIELLCYTDGRTISPLDVIQAYITPIMERRDGPFRRVWLMDGNDIRVLWTRSDSR